VIVLVTVRNNPVQRYVAKIFSAELISEVKKLVGSKKNARAITEVLAKGKIEKNVSKQDILDVRADLILSERSARWDLIK